MVDDELLPSMAEPIRMRLKKGMGLFFADVQGIGEILCSTIEGRFAGITPTVFKGYPYYALQLKDETNLYQVLFTPKAAILRYLVLCMAGEAFTQVYIEGYVDDDGRNKVRVWLDGERTYPHPVELPKIKRVRDGKGKPYHCLYGALLNKVAEMVADINKINNVGRI